MLIASIMDGENPDNRNISVHAASRALAVALIATGTSEGVTEGILKCFILGVEAELEVVGND